MRQLGGRGAGPRDHVCAALEMMGIGNWSEKLYVYPRTNCSKRITRGNVARSLDDFRVQVRRELRTLWVSGLLSAVPH